jgi:arylsulfatase A-like enzyme
MKRKTALLLALVVFALSAASAYLVWQPDAARMNVIILQADSLRADHLGLYGYARDTSPNLDRLSRRCVVFDEAYASWPATSTSVAAMMSGRYSKGNGVRDLGASLPPVAPTLAQTFRLGGYRTVGFIANPYLDRPNMFDRGFDEYYPVWSSPYDSGVRGVSFGDREAKDAISWMGDNRQDSFFMWAFFIEPHGPYKPEAPFDGAFLGDRKYNETDFELNMSRIPKYQRQNATSYAWYVSRYDAYVRSLDDKLGEILDWLASSGLDNETIIVVTSDHGESLGESGMYFSHNDNLDQAQVRVPLLICHPGARPGRVGGPVSLVDVYPTLARLAGVEGPPITDGADLMAGGSGRGPVFIERYGDMSVADGDYRLTYIHIRRNYTLLRIAPDGSASVVDDGAVKGRLMGLLADWERRPQTVGSIPGGAAADEQTKARLLSLGYAG